MYYFQMMILRACSLCLAEPAPWPTPVIPLLEDLNPVNFGSNDQESEADPYLEMVNIIGVKCCHALAMPTTQKNWQIGYCAY